MGFGPKDYAWWHVMEGGGPSGPVQLVVAYTSTQFVFKWKAPAGSELTFHWGDGQSTTVSGNDDSLVTTTSPYLASGTYTMWITGDVTDLTYIDINGQAFVSGSVVNYGQLTNLDFLAINATGMFGSVAGWGATSLTYIRTHDTNVSGSIEGLAGLSITSARFDNSNVEGDASLLSGWASASLVFLDGSLVTWDTTTAWSGSGTYNFNNCGWTSAMVNNSIVSFKTNTNATHDIAGDNAHRTAASNADLNTLYENGNTITLNDLTGAEKITGGDFALGIDLNLSNCENFNYTTFGTVITPTPTEFDATSNGSGKQTGGTADEISFVNSQKYIVTFNAVLNGGLTAPFVNLYDTLDGSGVGISIEGGQLVVSGANVFEFTASSTTTGVIAFINISTTANFEIINLHVKDADTDWAKGTGWIVHSEIAAYDDANDDAAILQTDGDMASSIGTAKVYRAVFKTDATPTTAAVAIMNAAEDVVYLAQDDYTDDTHTRYFTTPADVSGAGIAFVAYQSGDAFDLDDVSLKEVTFP